MGLVYWTWTRMKIRGHVVVDALSAAQNCESDL